MPSKLPIGPDQRALIGISGVAGILPAVAVILRIVARRMANRPLNSSDYLIIPAAVLAAGFQTTLIVSILFTGNSYHMAQVTQVLGPQVTVQFFKIIFGVQLLYTLTISLTKLSILELYLKIFPTTRMTVAGRVTQAIVIMWAVATFGVTILLCQPVAYNWDTSIEGGKCGDSAVSWSSTGILNIITDVIVLVLPIPYLARVKMATYKKAVLIVTFTLGVFTTAIGIVRLLSIIHMDYANITYGIAWPFLYSALECSVAVTLSCIPLLRPLLGRSRYSKNGTARWPSTWTGLKTTTRQSNEISMRMNENTSELGFVRRGPAQEADFVAHRDNNDDTSSQQSDIMSKDDILVKQLWDLQLTRSSSILHS